MYLKLINLPVFCIILCIMACQNNSNNTNTTKNVSNKDTTNNSNSNTTPPNEAKTKARLKLSFVGDIMGHGDQIKAAFDEKNKIYDYEPCFRYIQPIMEEAHLAIGNLELTLNNRNHYTGYPRFRSPDTLAYYLKKAGFDIIVTANNHSNDDDLKGVVHTLDVLKQYGFVYTGTFRNQQERDNVYPLIVEHTVEGIPFKFALLNYTYGTNGIPTQAPCIVNLIDTVQMLKDIQKAKLANPDIIITMTHWGSEYKLNESTEQRQITQFLWKNGVDVVVGAHPHVIQPVKMDTLNKNTPNERTVICAYSLGNFVSNQTQKNTDIGLIFELELEKDLAKNKTYVANSHYIPAWRYIYNKSAKVSERVYSIIPSSAFENDSTNFLKMSKSEIAQMKLATTNMRNHLGKWSSSERLIPFESIIQKQPLMPNQTTYEMAKVNK